MPGRDPAKGARDTGRTGGGIGSKDGAKGRDRGGIRTPTRQDYLDALKEMSGDSNTPAGRRKQTEGFGFSSKDREAASRSTAVKSVAKLPPNPTPTQMSTASPNYAGPPSAGQLVDSLTLGANILGGGFGTMGAVAGAVGGMYDDTGRRATGRMIDKVTGSTPAPRDGWAKGMGGTNANNDPSNKSGLAGGRSANESEKMIAEEERRKRRAAAQQTALGGASDSLLGPGVEPI